VEKKDIAIPLAAIESSYMYIVSPLGIKEHDHPDMPILSVALEYLTALEGPLWKRIRGLGLSYSYGMHTSCENGLIYFTLSKSTNLVGAYEEAYKIVQEFIDGKSKFEELSLQAAKSSLVFSIVSESDTIAAAAWESIKRYLGRVKPGYQKWMLASIRDVTVSDLQRVLNTYLKHSFDSTKSLAVVTTNPSQLPTILEGLKKIPVPRSLHSVELEEFFSDKAEKPSRGAAL